jgi:hypothetical protein
VTRNEEEGACIRTDPGVRRWPRKGEQDGASPWQARKGDPNAAIASADEGGSRSEAAGARPMDAAAERAREREGGGTSRHCIQSYSFSSMTLPGLYIIRAD